MKYGVKVKLVKDIKIIQETLRRMGVANYKTKIMWPSTHLYVIPENEVFFICHFKEMMRIEGSKAYIARDDYHRRNTIISLMEFWGLVDVDDDTEKIKRKLSKVDVISAEDVKNGGWTIEPKYFPRDPDFEYKELSE